MQQFKCIPAPAAGMENILGGVLTGIDADHLRAVLLKLAQEVGSERVIELCVEEAGIRGEPQWLAAMAEKASAPPLPTSVVPPAVLKFAGIIGLCDDKTFGACMTNNTFGLTDTDAHVKSLENLETGAYAFLYHVNQRILYGPFTVTATVDPDERDFGLFGEANTKYPHQVRSALLAS